MSAKPIYRRDGWVLCHCSRCHRLNYVEPHGVTAQCRCSGDEWVLHTSIPMHQRDQSATMYLGADGDK